MSVCWASDVRRLASFALALALVTLAVSAAPGVAKPTRDTTVTRTRSVTVDRNGVRIENEKTDPKDDGKVTVTYDLDKDDPHSPLHGHGLVVVDDSGAGLVRVFADAEVPAGDRVDDDVVAVFGSVHVVGEVTGNVVAVFGSVKLEPGSTVNGDVVAIGGSLDQRPGATVGGESVSLGFLPVGWGLPALPMLLASLLIGWLLTVFVGWLLALVFPLRLVRVAATASRRTALSFCLGILALPGFLVTLMLLIITVVGIPIAALLPVLYVIMVWGGQVAASYVLGSKLLRRRLGQGGIMGPILVGTLFVAMFFVVGALLAAPPGFTRSVALFFSLLGGLLVVGLSSIGSGAFLLSRFGTRPTDAVLEAPHGSPTPVMGASALPSGPHTS